MYIGVAECRILFWGHCDLDLDHRPQFYNNRVWSISSIIYDIEISNLVRDAYVIYVLWVFFISSGSNLIFMAGVLLTSVLENRVRSISPLFIELAIQFVMQILLGIRSVTCCFQVTVTLTSGFSYKNDESGAVLKWCE